MDVTIDNPGDITTTEPVTTASTEPDTTTGTSPATNVGANNTNGQEKFEYEEVKKIMEALDGEFKTFAEALKAANDLINENINVKEDEIMIDEIIEAEKTENL